MILRTAVVPRSTYEWHLHRRIALDAGASIEQVAALMSWPVSDLFNDAEKAALLLTETMLAGNVPDELQIPVEGVA